jgi:uroporphyrinogen-III synthase
LEEVLPANGIEIQAIEIYKTQLLDHVVKGHFDGLLFFSPSAVRAYAQRNTFDQSHSFCLGTSTAKAVALHTQDYTIAKAPDEAQLLKSLINHTIRYEE